MENVKAVFYCDGSCRGNPGYAGSGTYGYIYKDSDKPKNHKHPQHATLYFTPDGIQKDKSNTPIEVISIVEAIRSINSPTSTNNEAELLAAVTALQKTDSIENLCEITIFTDSNYIVTAFNENLEKWKLNNWRRIDNKPIVHLKEWTIIDNYNQDFIKRNIKLNIIWVKGHSDNHGNIIADLYSVIGSNAARQLKDEDSVIIFDQILSYADYKKSYDNKDFIFYFRDLYFCSNKLNDANYCFLSSSDDPNILGKRNNFSIFVSNIGYVPPIINRIKEFYREIQRDYVTTCCIKINKLENRDVLRLTELIDTRYLLVRTNQSKTYSIVGDNSPFLFENSINFPFIVNASKLFNKMNYIDSIKDEAHNNILRFDVTDTFIDLSTNKIKLTNKDKFIDINHLIEGKLTLKQSLIIGIGYDIPSYLALKNIEKDIEKVYIIVENNIDNNFCTVYINIITNTRNIYSVNIENKYLLKFK